MRLEAKQKLLFNLIKFSGVGVALVIDAWLIIYEFVREKDVGVGNKLGFSALLVMFFVFLVLASYVKEKVKMRLQSVDVAKELGVVGNTNAFQVSLLNWLMIIIPIIIMGGLFYYTGKIFNEMGELMLKIGASLMLPLITETMANTYRNNEIRKKVLFEKEKDAERVAKATLDLQEQRKKVGFK